MKYRPGSHLHKHPPTMNSVDKTFQTTNNLTEASYAFEDFLHSAGGEAGR